MTSRYVVDSGRCIAGGSVVWYLDWGIQGRVLLEPVPNPGADANRSQQHAPLLFGGAE